MFPYCENDTNDYDKERTYDGGEKADGMAIKKFQMWSSMRALWQQLYIFYVYNNMDLTSVFSDHLLQMYQPLNNCWPSQTDKGRLFLYWWRPLRCRSVCLRQSCVAAADVVRRNSVVVVVPAAEAEHSLEHHLFHVTCWGEKQNTLSALLTSITEANSLIRILKIRMSDIERIVIQCRWWIM